VAVRPDLRDVEERLARVLGRVSGFLPDDQLQEMRQLVEAGEPGIALENLCSQLYEYDVSVPAELAAELEALAEAMGIRISPSVKVTP
jgi:hypothetical protein